MINAHPYPIFEGATLQQCIDTLRRAPDNGGATLPPAVRKSILAPLCEAAEGAAAEKLATGRRRNDTVHAIAVGSQLFPILVWSPGRSTEIAVYPPVARDRCSVDALRAGANDFGITSTQQNASFQQEAQRAAAIDKWLAVFHGSSPPKPLVIHTKDGGTTLGYDKEAFDEGDFASEVRALVDLLLRSAQAPQAAQQAGSGWGNLFGLAGGASRPQELSQALRTLANPRVRTTESAGPPTGLADDLVFADVWRDRIVAFTSQRTEGGRARLWIEDTVNGRACFREIPTPSDLPPNGVAMTLVDDEVRLYGGAYVDGTITGKTWLYGLQNAAHSGFPGDQWRAGTPLAQPVAWPVVATVGRDVFVFDGVKQLTEVIGKALRMPVMARDMHRLQNVRWLKRSAPPSDTTGATASSNGRVVVVGPGNLRDGKVYFCDTAQDCVWYEVPQLPKEVGVGQITLADDKITYTGGFDAQGVRSKDVYQIDLNSLKGRWEHVGTSTHASGKARALRRKGQLVSLMVTPTASRLYHLST